MISKKMKNLPELNDLSMFINQKALDLLEMTQDPVVQSLIFADIIKHPNDDVNLHELKGQLVSNTHVAQLAAEQRPDGGWGRFHSRDSKRNDPVPTTEWAVERCLSLGLSPEYPILKRTVQYIQNILTWKIPFPDPAEKNDRWPVGRRLFLAATLARIRPEDPLVQQESLLWLEIYQRTFAAGDYSPYREAAAHAEFTGASAERSYLVLNGRYQVTLIGSARVARFEPELDVYFQWIWKNPKGLGYLNQPLFKPPRNRARNVDLWLASHELLARYYTQWAVNARDILRWVWNQKDKDGFWDLGSRSRNTPYLPYSESWRLADNRKIDWTVRILVLLRRYVSTAGEISG